MGKVNKRQAVKHSNHHDNPQRGSRAVVRRHHSQNAKKTGKSKANGKPDSASSRTSNNQNVGQQAKPKIPFSKWDRVLLVGEGDFSFTLSLAQHHSVGSLVATCFDSKDVLEQKYPNVNEAIRKLSQDSEKLGPVKHVNGDNNGENDREQEEWNGFSSSSSSDSENAPSKPTIDVVSLSAQVLYGIDATKLSTTHKKALKPHTPFTKIVFNFPHVGGISTDVNRQVRSNQQLLVNFFNAAKSLLATPAMPARSFETFATDQEDDISMDIDEMEAKENEHGKQEEYMKHGQILVTIFEGEPYTLWNVRDLARHSGLKVLESFKFPWSAYPGYQHARTIGDITKGKERADEGKRKGAWRGEERDARCYVLALQDDNYGQPPSGARKRKSRDGDEDD